MGWLVGLVYVVGGIGHRVPGRTETAGTVLEVRDYVDAGNPGILVDGNMVVLHLSTIL